MKTNNDLKSLADQLVSLAKDEIDAGRWYTEYDFEECDGVTVSMSGNGYECYLYAYPYKKRTMVELWNNNNDHAYYNLQDYLAEYANEQLEQAWIETQEYQERQAEIYAKEEDYQRSTLP